MKTKSIFENVQEVPEDPLFGLMQEFKNDSRSDKINLGIGAYKTSEGKSWLFPSVKKAQKNICDTDLDKDYLPIDGDPVYIKRAKELSLGQDEGVGFQTPGGTAALRIGGEFIKTLLPSCTLWLSNPTWINHKPIFTAAGLRIQEYPYYEGRGVAFSKMLDAVDGMERGDVIVLHPCCHNPSGMDLSQKEWEALSEAVLKRGVIPFFDMAYLGLGEGVERDRYPIEHFLREGHEMLVATSFSKNFGLYGERAGLLSMKLHDKQVEQRAKGVMKQIIRTTYSNPPRHGAAIVKEILGDDHLREEWIKEVGSIRERLNSVRKLLASKLGNPFIEQGKGMFTFLGLSKEQVERLKKEHAIFMPSSSRINVAGLNERNIDTVIEAINEVS